ncbi:hypothetical protein E3N88_31180 [Mikania micrantha]|uniref:Uncharacterized protein n=1 Tax=Mikania micrantha TaxID=192012 RepID=A0A5N6LEZ6_9ASTR|nr:hypothetical protein E3N88_43431 [Mikania micrantha]KAD3641956.1 hypothetical protein E3N88_31180 [Mikania micrantha]
MQKKAGNYTITLYSPFPLERILRTPRLPLRMLFHHENHESMTLVTACRFRYHIEAAYTIALKFSTTLKQNNEIHHVCLPKTISQSQLQQRLPKQGYEDQLHQHKRCRLNLTKASTLNLVSYNDVIIDGSSHCKLKDTKTHFTTMNKLKDTKTYLTTRTGAAADFSKSASDEGYAGPVIFGVNAIAYLESSAADPKKFHPGVLSTTLHFKEKGIKSIY